MLIFYGNFLNFFICINSTVRQKLDYIFSFPLYFKYLWSYITIKIQRTYVLSYLNDGSLSWTCKIKKQSPQYWSKRNYHLKTSTVYTSECITFKKVSNLIIYLKIWYLKIIFWIYVICMSDFSYQQVPQAKMIINK